MRKHLMAKPKKQEKKELDFNFLLKYWLECGILQVDDVIGSSQEAIMKTVLDGVHRFKIFRGADGRWSTYVADPTKPKGRRDVKRKSLSDLYKFLIQFYDIDVSRCKSLEMTFEALYLEWVEYKKQFIGAINSKKSISPSTIRRYERDFEKYIKGTEFANSLISAISMTDLERFILGIIQDYEMSDNNAGNVIGYMNQAFTYARRSRYLVENPMEFVDRNLLLSRCTQKPPKTDSERILSAKEMIALKKAIVRHEMLYPQYMPDYAIELALLTGMRVGELAALKWSCVDDIYIHIDYSEHRLDYKEKPSEIVVGEPKNRKHRKIPLTKDMRALFKRMEAVSPSETCEFVFTDKNGDRFSARAIGLATKKRCKEAGISKGSIHRIRRTVSSLLNQHLPQRVVAELLGHTETVNELHYNYSVAETTEKANALSRISSIINLKELKEEKTG